MIYGRVLIVYHGDIGSAGAHVVALFVERSTERELGGEAYGLDICLGRDSELNSLGVLVEDTVDSLGTGKTTVAHCDSEDVGLARRIVVLGVVAAGSEACKKRCAPEKY